MQAVRSGFYHVERNIGPRGLGVFAGSLLVNSLFHEEKVARIMLGASYMYMGLSCLKNSSRRDVEMGYPRNYQRIFQGIGIALTCYGIYQVASELLAPQTNPPFTSLPEKVESSCRQTVDEAQKQFLSCNKAKQLWERALQDGPIQVRCALTLSENLAPHTVSAVSRTITFVKSYQLKVYSLLDAVSYLLHAKLPKNMCSMSSEEYVHLRVSQYHESFQDAHEISKSCVQSGQWPANWHVFAEEMNPSSNSSWRHYKNFYSYQDQGGVTSMLKKSWETTCLSRNEL